MIDMKEFSPEDRVAFLWQLVAKYRHEADFYKDQLGQAHDEITRLEYLLTNYEQNGIMEK
jgi:hypothetical protein